MQIAVGIIKHKRKLNKSFSTVEDALSESARCTKSGFDICNSEFYMQDYDANGDPTGKVYKYRSINGTMVPTEVV